MKEVKTYPKGLGAIMPNGQRVPEEKGFYANSHFLDHVRKYRNRAERRSLAKRPPVPVDRQGEIRVQVVEGYRDNYSRPLRIAHEIAPKSDFVAPSKPKMKTFFFDYGNGTRVQVVAPDKARAEWLILSVYGRKMAVHSHSFGAPTRVSYEWNGKKEQQYQNR